MLINYIIIIKKKNSIYIQLKNEASFDTVLLPPPPDIL